MEQVDLAILGATGAVGETLIAMLEECDFPVRHLYPLGSERSAGETILFKQRPLEVINAAEFDFSQVQVALFSAGGSVSAEYAPKAAAAGCVVIDNTSHFRMDEDVPLVIPEINAEDISAFNQRHIIANPNCSTIQMLVALKPLYDEVGIKRVNVATYQAVSGSGKKAISELVKQTGEMLNGRPPEASVYPKPIGFNLIPQIDVFEDNGYTKEEMKMHRETQKIFRDKNIAVNATAVRVPVFYGHSEAINIETEQKLTAQKARALLKDAPGVTVVDDPNTLTYPTPVGDASGTDGVFVGRIREDLSHDKGLNLWVVSDNIRKGAALNAIQIAEILVKEYL